MNERLKQLDQWLSKYERTVTHGHPLTASEIQQFESDNEYTLTKDLRTFYLWRNGIKIGNDFHFFSLEEALHIYRTEQIQVEPAGTDTNEFIDEPIFSPPNEVRQLLEEEREE